MTEECPRARWVSTKLCPLRAKTSWAKVFLSEWVATLSGRPVAAAAAFKIRYACTLRDGPVLPGSARKKEGVRGRLRTRESLVEIGLEGGPEPGIQGHRPAADPAALDPMAALEPLAGKGDFGPDAGQVPYVPDPDGEQFRDAESRQPAEEKEHLVAGLVRRRSRAARSLISSSGNSGRAAAMPE